MQGNTEGNLTQENKMFVEVVSEVVNMRLLPDLLAIRDKGEFNVRLFRQNPLQYILVDGSGSEKQNYLDPQPFFNFIYFIFYYKEEMKNQNLEVSCVSGDDLPKFVEHFSKSFPVLNALCKSLEGKERFLGPGCNLISLYHELEYAKTEIEMYKSLITSDHSRAQLACNPRDSLCKHFGFKDQIKQSNKDIWTKSNYLWFNEVDFLVKTFRKLEELPQEEQYAVLKKCAPKSEFGVVRPHNKFGVEGNLRGESLQKAHDYLHDPSVMKDLLEGVESFCTSTFSGVLVNPEAKVGKEEDKCIIL